MHDAQPPPSTRHSNVEPGWLALNVKVGVTLFDGSAGLLYTTQRVTADLILSMHLLRRDLKRLVSGKASG